MENGREGKRDVEEGAGDMIICSPATPQRPRGETSGTAAGDCDGDPRKMDRPNVGQITFFSGRTKTAEIGREKGRVSEREGKRTEIRKIPLTAKKHLFYLACMRCFISQ